MFVAAYPHAPLEVVTLGIITNLKQKTVPNTWEFYPPMRLCLLQAYTLLYYCVQLRRDTETVAFVNSFLCFALSYLITHPNSSRNITQNAIVTVFGRLYFGLHYLTCLPGRGHRPNIQART